MNDRDIDDRIQQFSEQTGYVVADKKFGFGQDGTVFFTDQRAAVKVFARREAFEIECECYRRLLAAGIEQINGFFVPQLIRIDESLGIIEMTPVKPPCLLDFGKCHLDRPPDFSAEVMEEWRAEQEMAGN